MRSGAFGWGHPDCPGALALRVAYVAIWRAQVARAPAALVRGLSVVGPRGTPASCAALRRLFRTAGSESRSLTRRSESESGQCERSSRLVLQPVVTTSAETGRTGLTGLTGGGRRTRQLCDGQLNSAYSPPKASLRVKCRRIATSSSPTAQPQCR